jgi:F-type H+-transporting ATPase subunit b
VSAFYAELVGFVIFIGIIVWKVVPAIQRILDRRRDTIRSAIEGAAATLKAAEDELARRKALLEEARSEAVAILAQADATAAQIRVDGRQRAEQEYQRLEEVAAEIGAIVVEAAEQVVRAELDAARQRALVDEVIAAAQSAGAVR